MIMYMATSRANNSKAYNGGYEVVLATRSSICLKFWGYFFSTEFPLLWSCGLYRPVWGTLLLSGLVSTWFLVLSLNFQGYKNFFSTNIKKFNNNEHY